MTLNRSPDPMHQRPHRRPLAEVAPESATTTCGANPSYSPECVGGVADVV